LRGIVLILRDLAEILYRYSSKWKITAILRISRYKFDFFGMCKILRLNCAARNQFKKTARASSKDKI